MTYHIYTSMLSIVDTIPPYDRITIGTDLNTSQGITMNVVVLNKATPFTEYVHASLMPVIDFIGSAGKTATITLVWQTPITVNQASSPSLLVLDNSQPLSARLRQIYSVEKLSKCPSTGTGGSYVMLQAWITAQANLMLLTTGQQTGIAQNTG